MVCWRLFRGAKGWEGVWGIFLLFNTCMREQWGLSSADVVSQACRKGCAGNGAEFPLCSPHKVQGAAAPVTTSLPGLPVAFLMPLWYSWVSLLPAGVRVWAFLYSRFDSLLGGISSWSLKKK